MTFDSSAKVIKQRSDEVRLDRVMSCLVHLSRESSYTVADSISYTTTCFEGQKNNQT